MQDGSTRSMGAMSFIVKKLPKPYAEVGRISINKGRERPIELKSHNLIKAKYDPNFLFQGLPLKVVSFKIEAWSRGINTIDKDISGSRIPPYIKTKLGQLKRKDLVYFTKIKVRDVSGNSSILNDVVIEVK